MISDSLKEDTATREAEDSIRKKQELIDEYKRFYLNPLVKEGDFSFKTGYEPLDKIKERFDHDIKMNSFLSDYVVIGDCGKQYKSMTRNTGQTLHYLKGDCGDYGFNNAQYYLENDSLRLVRDFDVNLESYHDDPQGITWSIEEVIYIFKSDQVEIKNRKVITSDFISFDYSFKNHPFKVKHLPVGSVYEEKKKEMVSALESN